MKQNIPSAGTESANSRLSVPDLISIGVYTALYFVLVTVATFASAALLPGFSNVLLPGLSALICGCVYMLMVAKVHRFGGITVMGTVMGLFLFVSGHFAVSLVIEVACSVLADLVAGIQKYKNRAAILGSYVLFSFGLTGPVLPLWLMKDAYVASLTAKGKDASYIENLFANINTVTLWVCILATLMLALLGGWFGMKMLKKHFVKAGII